MRHIAVWLRHHIADTLGVLFIVVALTFLLVPVVHAGLDRNQKCVSNAFTVSSALLTYAWDYDERLPRASAYNNATEFQTVLSPYTRDSTVFRCPATGNVPYATNQAVGGVLLSTIPQVSVVEAFRDANAHPDGKLTVAYLDGHVERGGVVQHSFPGPATGWLCLTRQRGILTALSAYAQNNDGVYPFQQDDDALRSALTPYTNNSRLFECPDSEQPYILGTEFRGKSVASILDRSPIMVATDPVTHRENGFQTTAYLDGYLEQTDANGIVFPGVTTASRKRLRDITIGLKTFAQNNQGNLPVYSNYDQFAALLMPYIRASRTFLPPRGGLPFQVNLSLSGTAIASYPNPSTVIVIRDVNDYGDGLITVGYLNGQSNRIKP